MAASWRSCSMRRMRAACSSSWRRRSRRASLVVMAGSSLAPLSEVEGHVVQPEEGAVVGVGVVFDALGVDAGEPVALAVDFAAGDGDAAFDDDLLAAGDAAGHVFGLFSPYLAGDVVAGGCFFAAARWFGAVEGEGAIGHAGGGVAQLGVFTEAADQDDFVHGLLLSVTLPVPQSARHGRVLLRRSGSLFRGCAPTDEPRSARVWGRSCRQGSRGSVR